MERGRSPRPDGVAIEFCGKFWDLISDNFTPLVFSSVQRDKLPTGMTSDLIALILKSGDRENLSNWCLVTLLNVAHKILIAKVLQGLFILEGRSRELKNFSQWEA